MNTSEDFLPHITLVLASQSPARLETLKNAGITPHVCVSHTDEDAIMARIDASASGTVAALATAKAREVAKRSVYDAPTLVLGCDSMLEMSGEVWGKPKTPETARERLRLMAGNSGVLHTGHCLVNPATGASLSAVSHARVHIAPMSDSDIDAYIATGEPLHVAGSFTVDGIGGPFIEGIEGDYHGVVGVSLPLVRSMLNELGLSITQLWTHERSAAGTLNARGHDFLFTKRSFIPRNEADGFLLCSCGSRHWGLAGAGGILAVRTHEGVKQVLLQLRTPTSHNGGTWGIPGGAREWGESFYEGAVREFAEETGIAGENLRCLDSHEKPAFVVDHGDWSYRTFLVECEDAVAPVSNSESLELRWVNVDGDMPEPLHPAFAEAWGVLRERISDLA